MKTKKVISKVNYGICHIYFISGRGQKVAEKAALHLSKAGSTCHLMKLESRPGKALISLKEFRTSDVMIFVASTGIAVRAIASYIRDKQKDPAVIAIDETSKFVVPVLGGHIRRGNELSVELARALKAEAVITTASDNLKITALDVFAEDHGLKIRPTAKYKNVAARLNDGEKATFIVDESIAGTDIEQKIRSMKTGIGETSAGPIICLTASNLNDREKASCDLVLSPKKYSIGIGFRKEAVSSDILKALKKVLKEIAKDEIQISRGSKKANASETNKSEAITSKKSKLLNKVDKANLTELTDKVLFIATIDIKKGVDALAESSKKLGIPVKYYTATKLQKTINADPAGFSISKSAQKNIGINGVCEPAAVLAASNGKLVMKKRILWGITVAVARENCL